MKHTNLDVIASVLGGERQGGMNFETVHGRGGDPRDVWEAVCTSLSPECISGGGADERLKSRRFFGTTERSTVIDCPKHHGMSVSELVNAKHSMAVLLQLDLVSGGDASIGQLLENIKSKSRDLDGEPDFNSIILRDCPLCIEDGIFPTHQTRTARCFDEGSPRVFLATAGSTLHGTKRRTVNLTHAVEIYGSTYYLTGIIYCTGGGKHFDLQMYFGGCWRYYNDMRNDGEFKHTHCFDPELNRGSEYQFMYTRHDLVRTTSSGNTRDSPQHNCGWEHDPVDHRTSSPLSTCGHRGSTIGSSGRLAGSDTRSLQGKALEDATTKDSRQVSQRAFPNGVILGKSPPRTSSLKEPDDVVADVEIVGVVDGEDSEDGSSSVEFLHRSIAPLLPPLLTDEEFRERARNTGWDPAELARQDSTCTSRLCADEEFQLTLRLIPNDSNNCFAMALLLSLVALSTQPGNEWPTPDEVTDQAKPYFCVVEKVKLSERAGGYSSLEEAQDDLRRAVDIALTGTNNSRPMAGAGCQQGDPSTLVEALCNPGKRPNTGKTAATRKCLGMDSDWFILDCDTHEHDTVGPPLTYTSPVTSPYPTTLPRRNVHHDAAQAIAAVEYSSEQEYDPSCVKTGRCPYCPDARAQTRCWRILSGSEDPPRALVLRVGRGTARDGVKSPSASLAVVSQGKPYKLVAVIYDHYGCRHFSCQARFCGRWIYYDDVSMGNGKPTLYGDFNPTPENDSAGKPYMFLYARDYDTEQKRERDLHPKLGLDALLADSYDPRTIQVLREMAKTKDGEADMEPDVQPETEGVRTREQTRLRKEAEEMRAASDTSEGKRRMSMSIAEEVKADQELIDALRDAGYLRPYGPDPIANNQEDYLGSFWSAYVFDEFFLPDEEKAMPKAKHRGCPLDVLREFFARYDAFLDDDGRSRLRDVLQEYRQWPNADE